MRLPRKGPKRGKRRKRSEVPGGGNSPKGTASWKCEKCGACCRHWDLAANADLSVLSKSIEAVPFTVESAVIRVFGVCGNLEEDNTCRNYWKRPQVCREFRCNVGRIQ
jgi:Fe-S-cluster containining protein